MADSDPTAGARRAVALWRNRFQALLDHMPLPTAICRTDTTVVEANPALALLLGTTPAAVRDTPLTDLVWPRAGGDYDAVVDQLTRRRRIRCELAVLWSGGSGELTVQFMENEVWLGLLVTLAPAPRAAGDPIVLTPREIEVLRRAAAGVTTGRIAAELSLTVDGVNYHLGRMTTRLGVPNRAALVARAYTLGLLDAGTWPPR